MGTRSMRCKIVVTQLVLGVLLMTVTTEQSCLAQDGAGGGLGNSPMPPVGPTSPDFQRPVVPGPPMQPGSASRPSSWPGAEPTSSPWIAPPAPAETAPVGALTPCGRIIARVGSDAVLESDIIGAVNEFLEANKNRIPPDQVDAYREVLIQQRLKGMIETKLIYQDARRTIPTERLPDIEKKLATEFDDGQLEKMMRKAGANNAREFDQKLRLLGTSLEREKRAFIERALAQGWMSQQIKRDEEITYDQMVAYYREHAAEFTTSARAQWEELMVRYSKHPTKVAAFDVIARMGNQVVGGTPLADVARAGSDGTSAGDGGQYGWTSKGALVNQAVDMALFSLPVGQLSPIIEGPSGYHIIRVIQRNDETVKPFLEAQADIKTKIAQQRTEKQFRDYMAKLEARTPVWTIFGREKGKLELVSRPDESRQR